MNNIQYAHWFVPDFSFNLRWEILAAERECALARMQNTRIEARIKRGGGASIWHPNAVAAVRWRWQPASADEEIYI